jgi:hypothetical protein
MLRLRECGEKTQKNSDEDAGRTCERVLEMNEYGPSNGDGLETAILPVLCILDQVLE